MEQRGYSILLETQRLMSKFLKARQNFNIGELASEDNINFFVCVYVKKKKINTLYGEVSSLVLSKREPRCVMLQGRRQSLASVKAITFSLQQSLKGESS